jgi:dTDP-4-amino-4,6-dideoxygalactose transaminase
VNTGYNLRPQEINGAMGLVQLSKLEKMNDTRIENYIKLKELFSKDKRWKEQFLFPKESKGMTKTVWFGFNLLINPKLGKKKEDLMKFLDYLEKNGIQNRPIISGNFVRQPALKKIGLDLKPEDFPGAELVNNLGFFTGIHSTPIPDDVMDQIVDIFLGYEF